MFTVGIGRDSHRFSLDANRVLVLAGVEIPDVTGVEANSDGDVIVHALCDALESASGGNSFAVYADPMCRDGITDSKEYLKVAIKHLQERGYTINNISVSIQGKAPKIMPIVDKLRQSLSHLTGVVESRIGITATTGEELTAFGRGEGLETIVMVACGCRSG